MPGILDTPKKARIKGALQASHFLKKELGFHDLTHRRIASIFDVSVVTVHRISKDERLRTGPSESGETRGRKRKLTPAHCDKIIQLYDEYPKEAPDLPWVTQLMNACDEEASVPTIRKAMWEYAGYRKGVAAVKEYMPPKRCEERCSHCKIILEKYDEDDFLRFRYSDECHFGWKQRPNGRRWISRKPGERYEPRNIREADEYEDMKEKNVHVWGCIGLGFKSELVRYHTTNDNGKLSQQIYLNDILIPHVGRWLDEGHDFILEEDNDSGHGPSKSNIVRRWKDEKGLEYFFNAPHSPDIAPIENAWQLPNHYVRQYSRLAETADELFERAKEGWEAIPQDTIDDWVRSGRQRYKDVIENGGKMIARERAKKDDDDDEVEDADQFER